jgi:hypothetical protein
VTLLPVTRRGLPTAPPCYLALGRLSGEVEHPAGASPSKWIIIIIVIVVIISTPENLRRGEKITPVAGSYIRTR